MRIIKTVYSQYKEEIRSVFKIFLFGILFGGLFALTSLKTPTAFFDFINPVFDDVTKQIGKEPELITTFLAIFKRNLTATSLMVFTGLIHRIIPRFFVLTNGFLIGVVVFALSLYGQASLLWMIIPHGVFELPALFLAAAVGIALTTKADGKGISARYQALLKQRKVLLYIIGLLVIAGAIEAGSIVLSGS